MTLILVIIFTLFNFWLATVLKKEFAISSTHNHWAKYLLIIPPVSILILITIGISIIVGILIDGASDYFKK